MYRYMSAGSNRKLKAHLVGAFSTICTIEVVKLNIEGGFFRHEGVRLRFFLCCTHYVPCILLRVLLKWRRMTTELIFLNFFSSFLFVKCREGSAVFFVRRSFYLFRFQRESCTSLLVFQPDMGIISADVPILTYVLSTNRERERKSVLRLSSIAKL